MREQTFRGRRVLLPDGVRAAVLRVIDGRIASIEPYDATAAPAVVDAGDALLIPGLVDTHVHVNEPGRTEWEGFETATRAAAAGGVTTLLDMPLNSIPATTDARALGEKREAARGKCYVDVGFIGGVVPGNQDALRDLARTGVFAWKCFLVDSGVPEFAAVDERALILAMPMLAELGLPLMVHAEAPVPIARAQRGGPITRYADYLATRPAVAEVEAILMMIGFADAFRVPVHIVHLATGGALPQLDAARARGVPVTVETCPHYLTFASDEIPDGATELKCAPPIREPAHRDALWRAVASGSIDSIVSDHSPSPPAMKHRAEGDFAAAWGGIASLQVGLSVAWRGARARGVSVARLIDAMATRPAEIVRLTGKGRIAPGADADLVIFDPDAAWTVDGARLAHRHPLTPYHGMTLPGRVRATYLRGRLIYDGDGFPSPPSGRLLTRNEA